MLRLKQNEPFTNKFASICTNVGDRSGVWTNFAPLCLCFPTSGKGTMVVSPTRKFLIESKSFDVVNAAKRGERIKVSENVKGFKST